MRWTLEFRDVTVHGLPEISEEHTSVIFLWDGDVCSGWPITDCPAGVVPRDWRDIEWEPSELSHPRGGNLGGVRFWAYWPKEMRLLAIHNKLESER